MKVSGARAPLGPTVETPLVNDIMYSSQVMFILFSTFFTYYSITYKDEVIIATIIIVSLSVTTVTVVCAHMTANLLYH